MRVSGVGRRVGVTSELFAAESSAAVRKPKIAEPTAMTPTATMPIGDDVTT